MNCHLFTSPLGKTFHSLTIVGKPILAGKLIDELIWIFFSWLLHILIPQFKFTDKATNLSISIVTFIAPTAEGKAVGLIDIALIGKGTSVTWVFALIDIFAKC
jgi:hypothetical protein